MSGYNRAVIVGNLGRDAELRFTQDGTAVATLNVAVTEHFKDKNGQKGEKTEWLRCVVWDKIAENLAEFLVKGKQVLVEGRIQTRKWDDKEGVTRYTTEIRADKVVLLGGGPKKDNGGGPAPHPADVTGADEEVPF